MLLRTKILDFILVSLVLLAIAFFWTSSWRGNVLPLSPREENIPEISYMWNLYHAQEKGILFSDWNPLQIMGTTNITQRGYLLFAPIVYISWIIHTPIDSIYKLLVSIILFLSGLGVTYLLKEMKVSAASSLIGGIIYMLAPPHLAIGIEGFDFNCYWMLIPWILYIAQKFINSKKLYINSIILGMLLVLALITGTTYFVSTMPFFLLLILARLILTKTNKKFKFFFISLSVFFTLSAFFLIPSIIESKYSWIAKESSRKQIVNLVSPAQMISLYPKRIFGYDVLAFGFNGNYTDMSWYLGIITIFLVTLSIFSKKNWSIKAPLFLTSLGLVPFYLIVKFPVVKEIAFLILSYVPNLQAVYDHTFRMFLLVVLPFSILSGFGAEVLFKQMPKKITKIAVILIFALVLIDFLPYRSFFRSIPYSEIELDNETINKINSNNGQYRHWFLFPYVWHLPKYRYEYLSKYFTLNRANSSFLYIPYSSVYASEIYDVKLAGAIERFQIPIADIDTYLEWGNVKYILLNLNVYNYNSTVDNLINNFQFSILQNNNDLIVLERKNLMNFAKSNHKFSPVPEKYKNDLSFWKESYQQNLIYYYGNSSFSQNTGKSKDPEILSVNIDGSEILLRSNAGNPLLISISQSWYPGWNTEIDGQLQPLLRVNYALLGVIVPGGNHVIRFYYKQPWYYDFGELVSISSVMIVLYILILHKKEKIN